MGRKIFYMFLALILLFPPISFAYDVSVSTDKFIYAANDTVFLQGSVKSNGTGVENASVAFSYSGPASYSATFITNTTGEFNYTFLLSASGTYAMVANYSGDSVTHTVKVKPYKYIILKTDKPTYTAGDNGSLTVTVTDANGAGVSSQTITTVMHYANKSSYSATISPSSAATDSAGKAAFTFLVPSAEGEYLFEVNGYESAVKFVVGGFEPSMKINPAVGAKNSNITIRIAAKTPSGQGIAISGQIVITAPNGTQSTITSLAQYNDTTGTTVIGVYENIFSDTPSGGRYSVKATITQSGSNLTREL
ncbi:MAG: Ig-like domain-containing protein, partial [Candidatus Aenigmarchaeota archaeon]|nr:Ig-like domain-containing protein [Candidatus Aenigmarchaeota archaeon]